MLAFGGTGSGKTVSLVIAGGLLDLGWDGILLDLKEDTGAGGLRDWCNEYADSHRIAYQGLVSLMTKAAFDPLYGLNADEARDTILSLTRFDDDHYKNLTSRFLVAEPKLLPPGAQQPICMTVEPTMVRKLHVRAGSRSGSRPVPERLVGYDGPLKNGKVVGKRTSKV